MTKDHIVHEDGTEMPEEPGWVFVFGSNLSGVHGAGAAALAREKYKYPWNLSTGLQGRAYGIPTKGVEITSMSFVLVYLLIAHCVEDIRFKLAEDYSPVSLKFFLTRIGCGLAGFKDEDIAPLFAPLRKFPGRVSWPKPWHELLEKKGL